MARGALADNLSALAALIDKGVVAGGASGAVAADRALPVLPQLATLLPSLQRGSVVACESVAGVSLALAVAAGPAAEGAWVGVAGLPGLVVAAAAELGVPPQRLVLVNEPGRAPGQRFGDATWGEVVSALIDGFDVVVLGAAATEALRPGTARRLASRLQARGGVLVLAGPVGAFSADVTLGAADIQWHGLADGHGVARARRSTVQAAGRRIPRPRRAQLWLPGPDGQTATADDTAAVVPLRAAG